MVEPGRTVGLVLESPPGDGSFVDHALTGRRSLGPAADRVAVAVGPQTIPDPGWRAVLAHGAGLRQVAERWSGEGFRVALTDWPDGDPVPGVSYVDWAWWEAGYAIGFAAAREGVERLAVVAGPAVATQRRIVAAARRGFVAGGGSGDVLAWHLESFQDHDGARAVAIGLGAMAGGLVLTSAGAAVGVLAEVLEPRGWAFGGFGSAAHDWMFRVSTDVAGGVADLLGTFLEGSAPGNLVRFGSQSGLLTVEAGRGASADAPGRLAIGLKRAVQLAPGLTAV